MTLAETIARNLRRIMEDRRMNGAELAAGVGVTKAAVYRWLEGQAMSLENLEACARELRVTPAYLCQGWHRE